MSKNAHFTGQPIFPQLLFLIPRNLIDRLARKHHTDHYYKKFYSYDHLVSMLYCCFHRCESLREVTTGMLASGSRLNHLGLNYIPRRSTLADANLNRSEAFFGELFHELVKLHFPTFIPDSRKRKKLEDRLFLLDSTTIRLFIDVMKAAGPKPFSGKSKGGMKAHVLMSYKHDLPKLVHLTQSACNDKDVFEYLTLRSGDIVVFDKAYNSYFQFDKWSKNEVTYVTRLNTQSLVNVIEQRHISYYHQQQGILTDTIAILGDDNNKKRPKITVRIVTYYDAESKKTFEFLTNNFKLAPTTIAGLYKQRWQVELLFKRIKQNYPLKYFLGESENAIKIQMWCALIADLLIKLIKDKIKRKWSFSNITGMIRLHLMTYINVYNFLENPDKALEINARTRGPTPSQMEIF